MSTPNDCCICKTKHPAQDLVFTWSRLGGYACRCHGCIRARRRGKRGASKKVAKKAGRRS